jgi:hypothetical protein
MGTNYYYHLNECPTCHRKEILHIGKSSGGWKFNFQSEKGIKSWKEWKEFIKNNTGKIIDEYDKELSLDELESWIAQKQQNIFNKSHLDYYPEDGFLDEEGYIFSINDFS